MCQECSIFASALQVLHVTIKLILFRQSSTLQSWLGFGLTSLIYVVCYSGIASMAGIAPTPLRHAATAKVACTCHTFLFISPMNSLYLGSFPDWMVMRLDRANLRCDWRAAGWRF